MADNETMDSALEKLPQLPIRPTSMLEKARVAYLQFLGNPYKMAEELEISVDEANDHIKAIRKMQLGDSRQFVADNVAMNIISGLELMIHHLKEQYRSLMGRGQKMLSVCCGKPFEIVAATDTIPEHPVCFGCKLGCNIELVDDLAVCKVKNDTFGKIMTAYDVYLKTIEKLGLLDNPEKPAPINVQQNIVVVDGKPQDYLKLPPMEMAMLLKDMKKELLKVDAEIEVLEQEIEEEESEKDEEESKDGEVPGEEEVPA